MISMGATTWTYPNDSITTTELIDWVNLFVNGANHAYSSYLNKTETFEDADEISIGDKWPEHENICQRQASLQILF